MDRARRVLLRILVPLSVALLAVLGVVSYLLAPRPARTDSPPLEGDTTGVINILIVGKDARALQPSLDSGTGRIRRERLSHSDIAIVCHVSLPRRAVNLVALPRDLLVEVPGHTLAAGPTDFAQMDKLTHTFALGGEPLLRRTVENLLGVRIHRYVAFDFDSFRMVFDLLRPFVRGLRVGGRRLASRDQALKFARQRDGLRYDDLDRCRNAVSLIRALGAGAWRLAGTRVGDHLLRRVFAILGPDTDLSVEEALRLVDALRAAGFQPREMQGAVLVSEGRPVTLRRYDMTLSCYLPLYSEIEKQVKRYLLDSTGVAALDFMTQQPYRWPWYMTIDYDSLPAVDSLLPVSDFAPRLDSARLATRLAELRAAKGDTLH